MTHTAHDTHKAHMIPTKYKTHSTQRHTVDTQDTWDTRRARSPLHSLVPVGRWNVPDREGNCRNFRIDPTDCSEQTRNDPTVRREHTSNDPTDHSEHTHTRGSDQSQ